MENYMGEIRLFAGNYVPVGWVLCDGRSLQISQYSALFSLIGATYGGDGRTTFNIPDLRGRVAVHKGQGTGLTNRALGTSYGAETVALAQANISAHTHVISVGGDATTSVPTNNYPGNSIGFNLYSSAAQGDSTMNPDEVGSTTNAGQPHNNMMPSFCLNYIMALTGIFPTNP